MTEKKSAEILQSMRDELKNYGLTAKYEGVRMMQETAVEIALKALSAKLSAANMERSERYYGGGWIACKDKLPEDETEVLVWFEYFRYGEYNRLFQTIGISYMYDGKWSGFVNGESGWHELRIIAWQPLPQPYKPDKEDRS